MKPARKSTEFTARIRKRHNAEPKCMPITRARFGRRRALERISCAGVLVRTRRWFSRHRVLSAVAIGLTAAVGLQLPVARPPAAVPGAPSASLSLLVRHRLAARNCAAACAVGLAPSRRGEPGYYPHLDADDDGVACEWWHCRWDNQASENPAPPSRLSSLPHIIYPRH